MRELVLLRGLPASGKSSFVEEHELGAYTLSLDDFRIKVNSVELTRDGGYTISQVTNTLVYKQFMSVLAARMGLGEFTVVDACHVNRKSVKSVLELAEKYNYHVSTVNLNISVEESKRRNRVREEYKRVPDAVVERMASRWEDDLLLPEIKAEEFDSFLGLCVDELKGKYHGVVVIGDIHSSVYPLRKVIKQFDDRFLYVFVGDYFDRGDSPVETFKVVEELSRKENVVMLLGNHEHHMRDYLLGEFDSLPRQAKETYRAFKEAGISESRVRDFYDRLRDYYAFKVFGKKYFVCHAGVPFIPERAKLISTRQLTGGLEDGAGEIDTIYTQNILKQGLVADNGDFSGFIQIHGHLNTPSTIFSYSLEDSVEFGGNLKYAVINPNRVMPSICKVSNKFAGVGERATGVTVADARVNALLQKVGIRVKDLGDYYSVNFSPTVFYNRYWNEYTVKARGLFIEKGTGKVVARSYDKFFNVGELDSEEGIAEKLRFPVTFREKANGFLGLASMYRKTGEEKRELKLFSKSMDKGRFVDMLREAWDSLKPETRYVLKRIMVERHVSAVFEVIHPNDRHIVDYKDEIKLYLLNFVENTLSTKVYTPEELLGEDGLSVILSDSGISLPKVLAIAHGRDEWRRAVTELSLRKDIEGAVSVDKRGFMVKVKTNWYRDLKASRKALWYGRDINAFTHYAIKHGLEKESVVVIKRQMDKEEK